MTDATLLSLAHLGDPTRFEFKGAVPWFRAHKRRKPDGREIVVTERDLHEIAEHMQALEREGRLFRLTNGHINPVGDEHEQPELLGFGRNARVGTFGPENVSCVLVDEYADKSRLSTLQQRPYRSAEYYAKSKRITGAAALLRDPELNLGVVLYADNEPWHYSESLNVADPTNDPSPEEVQHYEGMVRYLCKKFPTLFGRAAMGAVNGAPPEPAGTGNDDKPESMQRQGEPPELYALRLQAKAARREAEAARREATQIRQDRERDRCERIVEKLAQQYRMDPAREAKALLPMTPAEREAHIAYIKTHYAETPDADSIEVYSGRVEGGLEQPTDPPPDYDKVVALLRKNPGMSYEEALQMRNAECGMRN